jgi:hypothetical protein
VIASFLVFILCYPVIFAFLLNVIPSSSALWPIEDSGVVPTFVWQQYDVAIPNLLIWAAAIAGLSSAVAALLAWIDTPLSEPFITPDPTDPHVYYGHEASRRLGATLTRLAGNSDEIGLYLAPHLRLPHTAELRGIMIMGGPDSGKTNIIRSLITQSVQRGDRVVIHCNKGDMTQSFGADSILIAPHHQHSHAWDIAKDLADVASISQFASDLIPASNPRFFSDSARQILTDVILSLVQEHGADWTPVTLLQALLAEPEDIARRIAGVSLNAGALLRSSNPEQADKTVLNIMGSIWSAAWTYLRPMAWAWGNLDRHRRFSVRAWLADDYGGARVLLLQTSSEYSELSGLVAGGILKRVASRLADPVIQPDPNRRVFLFLDEFYMLPKIENLTEALAVGREKGLAVVVGFQSYAQLVDKYGERQARILWDMFQIKIFGRQTMGRDTEWLSGVLGKRKISVLVPNRTPSQNDQRPYVEKEEYYPTFSSPRLASELGVHKNSRGSGDIRGLIFFGGHAYRIDWPFTIWGKRRKSGYSPAEWVNRVPSAAKVIGK